MMVDEQAVCILDEGQIQQQQYWTWLMAGSSILFRFNRQLGLTLIRDDEKG